MEESTSEKVLDGLPKLDGPYPKSQPKSNGDRKSDHEKSKHECPHCGKSFRQSSTLKQHKQSVHENRKDYKCQECGKQFSQRANLKTHIDSIHENQNCFKCQLRKEV